MCSNILQTTIKIKKEKERNVNLAEKLSEEMKKQQEHTQKVLYRLEQVSEGLIGDHLGKWNV